MITRIKSGLECLKMDWDYNSYERSDSTAALWQCIKFWWSQRPRCIQCSYCELPMWWNGIPDEAYCCEGCAYYGPVSDEDRMEREKFNDPNYVPF